MYQNYTSTEGVQLFQQLPMVAKTVIIDNYSQEWVYVPGGNRYIRPFTYGQVVPLNGTTEARIDWQAPPNQVNIVGSPLGSVTSIWTDQVLAPTEGQTIQQAGQTAINLGNMNGGGTIRYKLPPGTQSIMILASGVMNSYTIKGVQSGDFYANASAPQPPGSNVGFASVPYTGLDTQIDVSVNASSGSPSTTYVIALLTAQVPQAQILGTAEVDIKSVNGGIGQSNAANSASVVLASDQLPISGNVLSKSFGAAVAKGANTTVLADPGGVHVVTVWGYEYFTSPTTAVAGTQDTFMEDSTGTVVFAKCADFIATAVGNDGMHVGPFAIPGGLQMPVGKGIVWVNGADSANTQVVGGTVYYTQT